METSAEWQPVIESIVAEPGVVLVIGAVDTGKTTFCLQLANAGVRAGLVTAVVDSDVGQSEIGPPGTIGMAILQEPVELLRDLSPKRIYFVGYTSPVNHQTEVVAGVKRMTEEALARGAQLVVVDTSGLVRGAIGRNLKMSKVQALIPRHIAGIRKGNELDPLIAEYSKLDKIKVYSVPSSPLARRKPQDYRSRRRRAMFFEEFHKAERHIIPLEQAVCWNTWFSAGVPLKWQYKKQVEDALRSKLLHAEVVGQGIYIVTETAYYPPGISVLQQTFKTRDITIVPASALKNVLVGLIDGGLNCLNTGILQAVDFQQRHLIVLSPIKTVSPIRVVVFGSMRVQADGVELGKIQPGEI